MVWVELVEMFMVLLLFLLSTTARLQLGHEHKFFLDSCGRSGAAGFFKIILPFLKTCNPFGKCRFLWGINFSYSTNDFTTLPPTLHHQFDVCCCFNFSRSHVVLRGTPFKLMSYPSYSLKLDPILPSDSPKDHDWMQADSHRPQICQGIHGVQNSVSLWCSADVSLSWGNRLWSESHNLLRTKDWILWIQDLMACVVYELPSIP